MTKRVSHPVKPKLLERRDIKLISTLSNGSKLFVEKTYYGRRYISDEIKGGIIVWETSLISMKMMKMAMSKEREALMVLYMTLPLRSYPPKINITQIAKPSLMQ